MSDGAYRQASALNPPPMAAATPAQALRSMVGLEIVITSRRSRFSRASSHFSGILIFFGGGCCGSEVVFG